MHSTATRHVSLALALSALSALALSACDDATHPTAPAERRASPPESEASPSPGAQFTVTKRDLGTLGGTNSRAIGNSDDPHVLAAVEALLADEDELVRGTAVWAYSRLAGRDRPLRLR